MKKILLLAASAVVAFSASAAGINDYLTITCLGEEVTEGAEIVQNEFEDYESQFPGLGLGNEYQAKIFLTNKTGENVKNNLVVSYTDNPTQAMADSDRKAWGSLQICFNDAVEGNNCLTALDVSMTVPANKTASYDFDNKGIMPELEKPNRKYKLTITAEGESVSFFVIFNKDNGTDVAELVAAGNTVEFYNLQGQRVDNPEKGLYIVKKNGKTSKMMLR